MQQMKKNAKTIPILKGTRERETVTFYNLEKVKQNEG